MNIKDYITDIGSNARSASRALSRADSQAKNEALENIASEIEKNNAIRPKQKIYR